MKNLLVGILTAAVFAAAPMVTADVAPNELLSRWQLKGSVPRLA